MGKFWGKIYHNSLALLYLKNTIICVDHEILKYLKQLIIHLMNISSTSNYIINKLSFIYKL